MLCPCVAPLDMAAKNVSGLDPLDGKNHDDQISYLKGCLEQSEKAESALRLDIFEREAHAAVLESRIQEYREKEKHLLWQIEMLQGRDKESDWQIREVLLNEIKEALSERRRQEIERCELESERQRLTTWEFQLDQAKAAIYDHRAWGQDIAAYPTLNAS